jgi:hypothetical protein
MTRLVYPSDDRRAAGSTTAIQIFSASDLAQLRADNLELRDRRRGDARHLAARHRIAGRGSTI